MHKNTFERTFPEDGVIDERQRPMDHTHGGGVRNVNDKWMVGNSVLEIDQDDD